MPTTSLPHPSPHSGLDPESPHTHQSPNKSSERIQHQIHHLKIPHLQNQLKELDAKRQTEGGQGRNPKPASDAEPLERGKKLRQEKAERNENDQVGNHFTPSIFAAVKKTIQPESQIMSSAVP